MTHIEIGTIETSVHATDGAAIDAKTTRELLREFMAHVRASDAHAKRVRLERDVNAGRTTEEIA